MKNDREYRGIIMKILRHLYSNKERFDPLVSALDRAFIT